MNSFIVIGAGAVGCLIGAKLAASGKDVTLVARGAQLEALIAQNGVIVNDREGVKHHIKVNKIVGSISKKALGYKTTFDVIFLTMKAHQIAPIVDDICRICHDQSIIVTTQNGIPWWYFYKHGGELDGTTIKSLDPTADLQRLPHSKIVGCILFLAAEVSKPGVVDWVEGRALPLGEPDRSISVRATLLSKTLEAAGFSAPVRSDFREEIWLKILGNVCFNPVSALTGGYISDIFKVPDAEAVCRDAMNETTRLASRLGCKIRTTVSHRLNRAKEATGSHATSMLQDVRALKPLEVAILAGVIELAELVQEPVPTIKTLHGLITLLDRVLQRKRSETIANPKL